VIAADRLRGHRISKAALHVARRQVAGVDRSAGALAAIGLDPHAGPHLEAAGVVAAVVQLLLVNREGSALPVPERPALAAIRELLFTGGNGCTRLNARLAIPGHSWLITAT
jgi:hypothetical protein